MEKTFKEAIHKNNLLIQKANQVKKSYNSKEGFYDLDLINELLNSILKFDGSSFVKKANKVSFRIAAIVVIEETIIKTDYSRDFLRYPSIVRQTKVRFKTNISNHHISKFPTIEDIHPKDPCQFYDSMTSDENLNHSNRAKKGHYKKSLTKILVGKEWMLTLDQTEKRLSDILYEVNLC